MKKRSHLQRSDLLWGVAAVALVVLQFWWLPGDRRSSADSYSAAIDGKLGLYRTLQLLFPRVIRDSRQLCPENPATLLIVSPDRYPSDREKQQLYEFVYQGGTVLFAPGWNDPDFALRALGIQCEAEVSPPPPEAASQPATAENPAAAVEPAADDESAAPAEAAAEVNVEVEVEAGAEVEIPMGADKNGAVTAAAPEGEENAGDVANPPTTNPTTTNEAVAGGVVELTVTSQLTPDSVPWRTRSRLRLPEWLTCEPLVESSRGVEAATWQIGLGTVTLCSSPDIFSNRSLLSVESRRLAVRLVEHVHQHHGAADQTDVPLVVCEFLNASESFRQTGALFSPALRSGTLQLILLAVLVLWHGFHRFGPAEVTASTGRRSLQDSARAVGNLQFRLNDGGSVVRSYLEYVRARLRQRYGPGVALDDFRTLAERTAMDPEEVRRQLRDAQGLAAADRAAPAAAAASLRWLSRLLHRLSGTASSRD